MPSSDNAADETLLVQEETAVGATGDLRKPIIVSAVAGVLAFVPSMAILGIDFLNRDDLLLCTGTLLAVPLLLFMYVRLGQDEDSQSARGRGSLAIALLAVGMVAAIVYALLPSVWFGGVAYLCCLTAALVFTFRALAAEPTLSSKTMSESLVECMSCAPNCTTQRGLTGS